MSSILNVSESSIECIPTLNWILLPFILSWNTIEGLEKLPDKFPLTEKLIQFPPSIVY